MQDQHHSESGQSSAWGPQASSYLQPGQGGDTNAGAASAARASDWCSDGAAGSPAPCGGRVDPAQQAVPLSHWADETMTVTSDGNSTAVGARSTSGEIEATIGASSFGISNAPPVSPAGAAKWATLARMHGLTESSGDASQIAADGIGSGGQALPHLTSIQKAFGSSFDLSAVRAHIGGRAGIAAAQIGAKGYAMGGSVVFREAPSLHLAAHEAAHVVQQSHGVQLPGGVGSAGDAYERHADAVADRVVRGESAQDLLTSMTIGRLNQPNVAVQRQGDDESEVSEKTTPLTGVSYQGKRIGSWSVGLGATLTCGKRVGPAFESKEAAIAFGRVHGTAAVVIQHQNWYIVHELNDDSWFYSFKRGNLTPSMLGSFPVTSASNKQSEVPGVVALVTLDGKVLVRQAHFKGQDGSAYHDREPASDWPMQYDSPKDKLPKDPLASFRIAGGKGLGSIKDAGLFERAFALAMRDTALYALRKSESLVQSKLVEFGGNKLPGGEREIIRKVAGEVAQKDRQIGQASSDYTAALISFGYANQNAGLSIASLFSKDLEQRQTASLQHISDLGQKRDERRVEKNLLLLQYPLLGRVDADKFQRSDEATQTRILREELKKILTDIDTTRNNILDESLDLWEVPGIVQATADGLGVSALERIEQLNQKVRKTKRNQSILNIGLFVLQLGLSIGAAFASGGLSLALTGGALAIGGGQAIDQTDEYFKHKSAANTDIDPSNSIINPQELGEEGVWLVIAWIGVGLDVVSAVKAVKALKLGQSSLAITKQLRTGTVWDKLIPTQPVYQGTLLPRSFELITFDGQRFWVHGNATEHIYEILMNRLRVNGPSFTMPVTTQQLLTGLHASIEQAVQKGIVYEQKIISGNWELIFSKPRQPGQLPVIKHAFPLHD